MFSIPKAICKPIAVRPSPTPLRRRFTHCRPIRRSVFSLKRFSTDWEEVEVVEEAEELNWDPVEVLTEEELQEELDLFEVSKESLCCVLKLCVFSTTADL